jgi:DNA replication protein DnaC
MGNRLQPAQQVIEYRGDAGGVITLFSSNLPMSHTMLVDRYGDRVASRLREMCNYIELNGRDRRKG